jgi:hypothetical protein
VVAGTALRAGGGLVLFWISARRLPVFSSLQLGNGFWLLASDARDYYRMASEGAAHGLATISAGSPSPAFTRTLAIALRLFGNSPVSAVALNAVAYAASCALVVAMWPAGRGAPSRSRAVALCGLSFAPILALSATQPLKDQMFVLLIVGAAFAVRGLAGAGRLNAAGIVPMLVLLAAETGAVYAISGIRAYFGLFTVFAVVAVMTWGVAAIPFRRWPLQFATTVVTAVLSWQAFVAGAGPYAIRYQPAVHGFVKTQLAATAVSATGLESARDGFVNSGGATNLATHKHGDSLTEKLREETVGLMALVLPTAALKRLPGVAFSGGRGLVSIADCDTVFIDACIVMELWLVVGSWRRNRPDPVFLSYCVLLAGAVTLPMAYVVTNYGTLLRLRIMCAVPLLLCGAALSGPSPLGRFLSRDPEPMGPA